MCGWQTALTACCGTVRKRDSSSPLVPVMYYTIRILKCLILTLLDLYITKLRIMYYGPPLLIRSSLSLSHFSYFPFKGSSYSILGFSHPFSYCLENWWFVPFLSLWPVPAQGKSPLPVFFSGVQMGLNFNTNIANHYNNTILYSTVMIPMLPPVKLLSKLSLEKKTVPNVFKR